MVPIALVGLIKSPWAKGLALAFLGLACVGVAYWSGFRSGSSDAHREDAENARKALEIADKKYRALEDAHGKQVETMRLDYARLVAEAKERTRATVSAITSDTKRVRFATARCVPLPTTATPSPGVDGALGTAELLPDDGRQIYGIAVAADKAIRKANALQAWAIEAVKLCNGGK